jgi:hypothetical protein
MASPYQTWGYTRAYKTLSGSSNDEGGGAEPGNNNLRARPRNSPGEADGFSRRSMCRRFRPATRGAGASRQCCINQVNLRGHPDEGSLHSVGPSFSGSGKDGATEKTRIETESRNGQSGYIRNQPRPYCVISPSTATATYLCVARSPPDASHAPLSPPARLVRILPDGVKHPPI